MRVQTKLIIKKMILYNFLVGGGILFILPFYWMIVVSTLKISDLFSFPPKILPGGQWIINYRRLVELVPFYVGFLNSAIVAICRTFLTLFLCSLAGFAFAKYNFPGRNKLFLLMLATMMFPITVNIIPYYIMMSWFGWTDTLTALIIPGAASAFGIFLMRQYISQGVPTELLDAARIDGCSEFAIYWRIVVPLSVPVLGTLGILTFLLSWNDYITPLVIINTLHKYTLPLILASFKAEVRTTEYPAMMVGATLSIIPILIVYLLANKLFVSALTKGAIKG